jgi:PQQ-dependent dehydrogenase (methanol/ethanol family)
MAAALLVAGCFGGGGLADKGRLAAKGSADDWLAVGGSTDEQHYSPLAQINDKNVSSLAPAWVVEFDVTRGQEGEPLVVDGVVYLVTAWSKVHAIDGATGRVLWSYDPQVPGAWGANGCCDVVSRGLAFDNGKIYLGAYDGRLIAIDAKTGKERWSVNTIDRTKKYTITGAPRVFKGKVVIGNGGAEYPTRGYVTAYDVETGAKVWRFYTVPGEPGKKDGEPSDEPLERLARSTWFGDSYWKNGGGGTAWDAIVYDRELDRLYIGTGNGAPHNHYVRSQGKGDNLFLASIVAVNPDTGEYIWHYQVNPGESWDYTAVQPIILADLDIGGKRRKVLMQAPKNGFFYVIDRETGQPISAAPFVPNPRWASAIDPRSWRPVEAPGARYIDAPFINMPGPPGAHNWQPMAYSPDTGLVYLPTSTNANRYAASVQSTHASPDPHNLGDLPAPENYLQAWDPVTQKSRWKVPVEGFRTDLGGGGVLATAGNLVFQGRGEITGEFLAIAADTGKVLWRVETPDQIMAAPVTYRVNGEQYVVVAMGSGGPSLLWGSQQAPRERQPARLVAFKLGGKAKMPPPPPLAGPANPPAEQFPDALVTRGGKLYDTNCSRCHGRPIERASNLLPDLRRSGYLGQADAWRTVVMEGALADFGMVSFVNRIGLEDAEAIRAYVGRHAQELARRQQAGLPERLGGAR